MKKYRIQEGTFHKTAEGLREIDKENNIKLLRLWKYIKKRSNKKIQKIKIEFPCQTFSINRKR